MTNESEPRYVNYERRYTMELVIEVSDKEKEFIENVKARSGFNERDLLMRASRAVYKKMNGLVGYSGETEEIDSFIKEYCIDDEKASIPVSLFKRALSDFVDYHVSQKVIGKYMKLRRTDVRRVYINYKQVRCWIGLKLKCDIKYINESEV